MCVHLYNYSTFRGQNLFRGMKNSVVWCENGNVLKAPPAGGAKVSGRSKVIALGVQWGFGPESSAGRGSADGFVVTVGTVMLMRSVRRTDHVFERRGNLVGGGRLGGGKTAA